MSSGSYYDNNAASTPTWPMKLEPFPILSESSIEETSSQKKHHNLASGRFRHVKYESTKSGEKSVEIKKRARRPTESSSGPETDKQISRETALLVTPGKKTSVKIKRIGNIVTVQNARQKAKKIETIFIENCDASCGTNYPWEKPPEVIRDAPQVVDDVESIFDKPLPRLSTTFQKSVDPSSEDKNDIETEDPQFIDLDDETTLVVGDHNMKYPASTISKGRFHQSNWHSTQSQYIRNRQLMLEVRHGSQNTNKKWNRSEGSKSERESPPRNTATVHIAFGNRKKRIYNSTPSSSSSEENSNDEVYIYQWNGGRGKYVRHPLSPMKSIGWMKGTEEIEKDKLWDEFYREYKESLHQRSDEATKVNEFRDHRSEHYFNCSRRKIDQAKIAAATKDPVGTSRLRKKSKLSVETSESSSSLSSCQSSVGNRQDDDNDSSPADFATDVSPAKPYDHLILENQGSNSESSEKNWRSESRKKSLKPVKRPGEESDKIFQVQSGKRRKTNNFDRLSLLSVGRDSIEKSPSNCEPVTDDSPEDSFVIRPFKRRKGRNFDRLFSNSLRRHVVEISSSDDEPEEIIFENSIPEQERKIQSRDKEKNCQTTAPKRQAIDTGSVEQYRRKRSSKPASEIPEKDEIDKACGSFSRIKEKASCSSDEDTSGDSEATLIVDHARDQSSQSQERLDTILEETKEDESFTNEKIKTNSISSQSRDHSLPKKYLNSNPKNLKCRSTKVFPIEMLKKCGSDRWLINLPQNLRDE